MSTDKYIYLSQELTVDHDMDPVHVAMYIRNSVSFNVRNDLRENALKFLCVEISKPKVKPFLILKWYRPSKGLFIWSHLAGTRLEVKSF